MTSPSVRVIAVTQDDPFFVGRFFGVFLPGCAAAGVDVVEIAMLPNFTESKSALLRRLLRFYGPVDLTRLVARYTRAFASEHAGRPRSVEAHARRNHVPVRRLTTINDRSYLSSIGTRKVDVLLSVAAPEIFRAEALSAAPYVLNVHSGKLPTYRGMMPTFWALRAGDDHVTVTVHEMVERLDAGRVLAEFPVPVEDADSVYDVSARAKVVSGREVARLLSLIGTERWPIGSDPPPVDGPAFRFPTSSDARALRASGRQLL